VRVWVYEIFQPGIEIWRISPEPKATTLFKQMNSHSDLEQLFDLLQECQITHSELGAIFSKKYSGHCAVKFLTEFLMKGRIGLIHTPVEFGYLHFRRGIRRSVIVAINIYCISSTA
jgi:hypothetical protein